MPKVPINHSLAEHYFDRWDDAVCCGIKKTGGVALAVKGLMDIGGGYGHI